jgi:ABC-type hemin transport system substrate-binding protein
MATGFCVNGAGTRQMEDVRKQLLADPVIAASNAGRAGHVIIIDDRIF